MVAQNREQSVHQIFSGAGIICFGIEIGRRQRRTQADAEAPLTFINDTAGNYRRLVAACEAQCTRRHLQIPTVTERDLHLASRWNINRDEQVIAGGEVVRDLA